ncbi:MAG: Hpt domain-containing protein [Phenylobacterium sp.]
MTAGGRSGAVDFDYLEGFAARDMRVVHDVLALFRRQAEIWSKALGEEPDDWRDMVHTIKGAARGVGANTLGDVCAHCEWKGAQELALVRDALDAAVADIAAYQAARGEG